MNSILILLSKKITAFTSLLLLFTVLVSCDINDDESGATMRVLLTDAPALYDEVNIDIRQVMVSQQANAEFDDEDSWEVIMEDSIRVNLLDYQHGSTLELGETELEAGHYNQLRLILGTNNEVVIGGESFALSTPSAQQSGYKLNIQADVEEGEVYELVIDFDALRSIQVTGNGNFILRPVLRTVDLQQDGSIAGTILPLEAEPTVYAIMEGDSMATFPDEEGNFKFIGLDEGTYSVYFEPANEMYADSLIEGIEIENNEFTFDDTIVLQASASEEE